MIIICIGMICIASTLYFSNMNPFLAIIIVWIIGANIAVAINRVGHTPRHDHYEPVQVSDFTIGKHAD